MITLKKLPKKHSSLFIALLFIPILSFANTTQLLQQLATKRDKNKHWHGSLVGGFNMSTGNTETSNYLAQFNLSYHRKKWENGFNASTERKITNKKTTAKQSKASYTSRWLFNQKNYTYFDSNYTNDKFSPYINVANAGWGYGWRPINNKKVLLQLQAGPGYQYSKSAPNELTQRQEQRHLVTANAQIDFSWQINQEVKFTQMLGSTVSRINQYYTTTTALTASLINQFALQVSYTASHNTQVPKDSDRKPTDTTTNIALVYAF